MKIIFKPITICIAMLIFALGTAFFDVPTACGEDQIVEVKSALHVLTEASDPEIQVASLNGEVEGMKHQLVQYSTVADAVTLVPEPGTMVLLGIALISVASYMRRLTKKADNKS